MSGGNAYTVQGASMATAGPGRFNLSVRTSLPPPTGPYPTGAPTVMHYIDQIVILPDDSAHYQPVVIPVHIPSPCWA
jgi:hypothetical protein